MSHKTKEKYVAIFAPRIACTPLPRACIALKFVQYQKAQFEGVNSPFQQTPEQILFPFARNSKQMNSDLTQEQIIKGTS